MSSVLGLFNSRGWTLLDTRTHKSAGKQEKLARVGTVQSSREYKKYKIQTIQYLFATRSTRLPVGRE